MSKGRGFKDLFFFGLTVSLSGHLLWAILVVPAVNGSLFKPTESKSFFLGAILKESDLLSICGLQTGEQRQIVFKHQDFSKDAYFKKIPFMIHKPVAKLKELILTKEDEADSGILPISSGRSKDLSFGFSDISDYLYNDEDFSDLRKIASREELSSHMDFKVLLTSKGEVQSIKKIIGSGDPAFDLYVMLKLKKSIFKPFLVESGVWLNVRFRIKE